MREAVEQAANNTINPAVKKTKLTFFIPEKDISGKLLRDAEWYNDTGQRRTGTTHCLHFPCTKISI
jgi:hypothetical protein